MDKIVLPSPIRNLLIIFFTFLVTSAFAETQTKTMNHPESLQKKIDNALKDKGPSYIPRTRHFESGRPLYTNRLILEDSPYLLQHAHNPVDWYPWGEEAFEHARNENKPVFLSIGYATCHWCHVMEEESFENEEIAKFLNEHFIAIKVDREQYPDVDETYMTAVMLMTGSGGWPMSTFLLPDGRPFFGGTYFPPDRFIELLQRIAQLWLKKQDDIVAQAEQLSTAIEQTMETRKRVQLLGQNAIDQATNDILERYEKIWGGFSQAPKFPNEPSLSLLLETPPNQQKDSALKHTLDAMMQGGIHDQIGGGFHRYSTDAQWLVPHFEKMLYNQAYLSRIYAEAWRQYGDPLYARTSQQILDYVLREMTSKEGGFYSAIDADSEGEEGTFYLWTEDEIRSVLDEDEGNFAIRLYAVTDKGNFEGKNILHLPHSLHEIARQEDQDLSQLIKRIDQINKNLLQHRKKRIPPLTDNKIIVAWNGMMITALAEVGEKLNQYRYLEAAKHAAEFLWKSQRPGKGQLLRVNLEGTPSIDAKQEDYAHFAEALIALYDVTGDIKWLQQAQELTNEMLDKFLDTSSGAFLMGDDKLLFAKPRSIHDGATPSGNSVAVRVLSRLARRTGKPAYEEKARQVLQALSSSIAEYPASYAYMMAQLHELLKGETGHRQYAGRGAIKITGKILQEKENYQLLVELDITDGWHINAHTPLQKDLVATQISLAPDEQWKLTSFEYPKPVQKKVDFEERPLALYEGKIQIRSKLEPTSQHKKDAIAFPVEVSVQIQACNTESCLPPETAMLSLTLPYGA